MAKAAEIKTKLNSGSVEAFIEGIADVKKREDSKVLLTMIEKATKEKPAMWGNALIGFGNARFKSETSGREVEWFKIGFSPRKANISLHLLDLLPHAENLKKLGKHKTGQGCLYINKLDDIDIHILTKIIEDTANREPIMKGAKVM